MRFASRQADAFEVRKRAERRLGEMMEQQPKARAKQTAKGFSKNPLGPSPLAESGIDKNLADRARKAHAMASELTVVQPCRS